MNKDFGISLSRKAPTREKRAIVSNEIPLDFLQREFNESIERITKRTERTRQDEIENDDTYVYLLETQIVFLESAFDLFLHKITYYGLWQMFNKNWNTTDKYRNISVPMHVVEKVLQNPEDTNWFNDLSVRLYSCQTFLGMGMLKQQLKLLGIKIDPIAKSIFYKRGDQTPVLDKMTSFIDDLYEQRNIVAHQMGYTYASQKSKVTYDFVIDSISKIKKIADAIVNEIKAKNQDKESSEDPL